MEEIVQSARAPEAVRERQPEVYDAPRVPGKGPIDWMGGWKWGLLAVPILLGAAAVFRVYQGFTALSIGTDSSTPQFFWYYEFLVAVEIGIVGLFTILWWGWIIRSAKRLPEALGMVISRREEVRRIAVFWGLVGATSVNLYIEASFFPNQDGAWHQTLVRDTAFTPSHDPMFYFFFPLGVTLAIGTYLYGRTRLPAVYGAWKGFPWSFFLLIAATVTEVAQVAMNEWGHSVNLGNAGAEEFFSVWFHWPFVLYGWLAGGIFALWGETILRLYQIEKDEEEGVSPVEAATATVTSR
ncbi:MAG TPA: methane monooxygenase/ammonia monooxygenase subunit C [Candidatus Dormibacteraeota bacterium]|nr:methane monooxygenase/ammonia monooxygenase subunit C [Candidatus Dormibacteraeota bacterium]